MSKVLILKSKASPKKVLILKAKEYKQGRVNKKRVA